MSKLFRYVALFLVLFTGYEIVACELPGSDCAIVSAQSKSGIEKHQGPDCDNCICCCAHVLVVADITFTSVQVLTPVHEVLVVQQPISSLSEIEHPPQLS